MPPAAAFTRLAAARSPVRSRRAACGWRPSFLRAGCRAERICTPGSRKSARARRPNRTRAPHKAPHDRGAKRTDCENSMQDRRAGELHVSFFFEFARKRIEQGFAGLHPTARQEPALRITMPYKQHLAIAIEHRAAHPHREPARKTPIAVQHSLQHRPLPESGVRRRISTPISIENFFSFHAIASVACSRSPI
jgi:hypothetical protein